MKTILHHSIQVLSIAIAMLMLLTGCSASSGSAPAAGTNAGSSSQAALTQEGQNGSSWPGSTVTMYVPASAGGGTDTLTRILTSGLNEVTGENFVIVNDATGNGTVAAEAVRNSSPDGLTMYAYHSAFCGLLASGQYDHSFEDFSFVGVFTTPGIESDGLFVNADSPFQTMEDLVNYAKEHPGELISGAQSGQTDHFEQALLNKELGIDVTIVDCGGNAEKIPALMGNSIDMAIIASVNSADYVKSGDLRCLCTLGEYQSEIFSDVPTLAGCGYAPVGLPTVCFLLAPSGVPQEDLDQINKYLEEVSKLESVQEAFAGFGTGWEYMSREDGLALMQDIQKKYKDVAPIIYG